MSKTNNVLEFKTKQKKQPTAQDKAFAELAIEVGITYNECLLEHDLPTHDDDGVALRYEDVWDVCCAHGLIKFMRKSPEGYQLLCDEQGGEFELVKMTLLG